MPSAPGMSSTDFSLAELQGWMQHALIEPHRVDPASIAQIVAPSPRLQPHEQLRIYQRSYTLRLVRCLAEQFPALRHALGDDTFEDMAHAYLQDCPSDSYTLYELGRRFPAWLAQTRPDRDAAEKEDWIDFMLELVHFEREVFVLFDAHATPGLQLATPATPDAQLRLHPDLKLFEFDYHVAWYYHQVRQQQNPLFPPRQRSRVALIRRGFQPVTLQVSERNFVFLRAMQGGESVERALDEVARRFGQTAEQVREMWEGANSPRAAWIAAGFFALNK